MDKQLKDHKQIGQEQELFFTHELAPGAPFWLPKGMVIFKELEKYIRELTQKAGYQETSTPIMVKNDLFKTSGHWSKFGGHDMYNLSLYEDEEIQLIRKALESQRGNIKKQITIETPRWFSYRFPVKFKTGERLMEVTVVVTDHEKKEFIADLAVNYSLKPMNCPESTILYRFRPRSYRELPLRLSEIGRLHRKEESGELNGLLRVRQITMDDAHIYAREDQIFNEVSNALDMMTEFYKRFGFEYEFRFATRPEYKAGTDDMWDKAEKDLEGVLKKKGIKAGDKKGDGAFYGPKIDLHIKDAQEREWQLATVQLDFHMPQAFDLQYIDEKGEAQKPVMIHRAIFGSFERFIAILTEHFQGAFPIWLSPIQVIIIPISDRQNDYAQKVLEQLLDAKIRTEVDDRAETMQAKIRDAQMQKTPYMLIIGDREKGGQTISVRTRDGKNLGAQSIEEFKEKIQKEISQRLVLSESSILSTQTEGQSESKDSGEQSRTIETRS